MFASDIDCSRLAQCSTWLADGTFRSAPGMFFQLWVLHGLYRGRVLPFVYCLLPDKREATYCRALDALLEKIDTVFGGRRPTTIIIDFEKAVENTFRQRIPDLGVHGQAVWRKAQQLGMSERYVADEEYRTLIKMFSALTFCAGGDMVARFGVLAEEFMTVAGNQPNHHEFLDYFESTWIGRPGRQPLFSHAMWNNREVTLLHLPRTTNSVESWHCQIQSKFTYPHPNFFTFMEGIREENVRLDSGEEVPLYSRLEYRQANDRLLAVLRRYNEMDATTFLRATSRYIKYRGVDPVPIVLAEESENDENSEPSGENSQITALSVPPLNILLGENSSSDATLHDHSYCSLN